MTFWIPWGVDFVVALIFVYFFFIGLADGSVRSFNIGVWLVILFGLAGVVGGSLILRATARIRPATLLVSILAVPSVLIGLVYLVLLNVPARYW